jgi:UDPglucose 6-dehydrogenase
VNVAVLGLWHLGSVTAACTAAAGHLVAGWDPDGATVERLTHGELPVVEPGLTELLRSGLATGRLRFTSDVSSAVRNADVVWVTFDTPVDDEDRADVDYVVNQVALAFPHLKDGALVLSSSQLPVGSVGRLERDFAQVAAGRRLAFACSPENLRLGKAIEVFTHPDRVIVGVRSADDRARLTALFAPITDRIEWMSVESAEMTKHAINAFLATCVSFINEVAALCEQSGADAKEVERGLKTEERIGPHAYLGPGAAFSGGTLARDLMFLQRLGRDVNRATPLFDGAELSNRIHREWPRERLESLLGSVNGRTIAIWGLTYKPGTDTLRRSAAVDLCRWLIDQGARVRVHDPAVRNLPSSLSAAVKATSPEDATKDADALVVATEWADYRNVDLDAVAQSMKRRLVIDANGFLRATAGRDARFIVVSVGVSRGHRGPDVRDGLRQ